MNPRSKDVLKKCYFQPTIELIKVDNEIALALESLPPTFESKNENTTTDFFNTNPFVIPTTWKLSIQFRHWLRKRFWLKTQLLFVSKLHDDATKLTVSGSLSVYFCIVNLCLGHQLFYRFLKSNLGRTKQIKMKREINRFINLLN